jgi:outer membrane protein TolC
VAKIKYENGIGSNLEVVTAETTFKEAELNYQLTMYDAIVARIELEKALGTLVK